MPSCISSDPHIGEFVEPLHADDAAALEQLLRSCCAGIGGESVDQDIAVEKFARHRPYRALASSRSNFQSAGSSLRKARMRATARSRLLSRAMPNVRSSATWTSTSSPSFSRVPRQPRPEVEWQGCCPTSRPASGAPLITPRRISEGRCRQENGRFGRLGVGI